MEDKKLYKDTEVGRIPVDWEVKKLGEVFEFLPSGTSPRSDLIEEGNVKYIHYGDIHTKWNTILDCLIAQIPYIKESKVKNLPRLKEGDLIMADASEDYDGIGKSVEIANVGDQQIVAGLHTFLLRGNKGLIADGFKGYIQFIKSVKDSLYNIATGISVYGISKKDLGKISIPLPPLKEQKTIAKVLADIDELITSIEKLIHKKKLIKQGAMQELLSGKKRLPGFSGEWQVRKLGEIAEFYSGGTPLTSNKKYYGGTIPWITSGDLNKRQIREVSGRITELGLRNSAAKMVKKGTVLIALYGATAGVVAISEIDAAINQAILAIILKNDDSKYLYYRLSYMKEWITKTFTQGGQPNLSANIIKSIPIPLPPLKEQKAIAQILSDMDSEIESLEKKLEKYKLTKEAMMEKLLTGQVRLV